MALAQAGGQVLTVAALSLDAESGVLSGPRGFLRLARGQLRVLERLMRRAGVLVSGSDLMLALYPDGEEPDTGENVLRHTIRRLRASAELLAPTGTVRLRAEIGGGYAIEAVRPVMMERAA